MAISRARQRYIDFINADYGHSFAEWLGIDVPKREYIVEYPGSGKRRDLVRLRSSRACGEYKPTLKEAKESYKSALSALKAMEGR